MGNKKKTIFTHPSQLHTFSFFKCKFLEISNDCKSIKVAQLKSFDTLLNLKNKGIVFFFSF